MVNTTIHPTPLYGAEFSALRNNPDRGFRLETYIQLGSNTVTFHKEQTPLGYLDEQIELYKDYPVHLAQVYVYLSEYCNKSLDAKAFTQLQAYLEGLKQRKLRAVLRFAYEFEVNRKIGPTTRQIQAHLEEISKWMSEHEQLVKDTILVLQAGFFGAWGEWHTAKHFHSKKKLLSSIADILPDTLPLQVRREYMKKKVAAHKNIDRIGFHDDYLVGVYHKWSTPDKPDFTEFSNESAYLLNDGEMPWGKDTSYRNGWIDGLEFLKGCALRHLSSLSITHNFIEDGKTYNMARWQGEALSSTQAVDLELPYTTTYFKNAENEAIDRTVFDYLTDHLGYLIFAKEISFTEELLSLTLSNVGFALPYGFSSLVCYVKSKNGEEKAYPFADFKDTALLGGTEATFQVKGDFKDAVALGFSLRKPNVPALCGIRFANDCTFNENINWFNL